VLSGANERCASDSLGPILARLRGEGGIGYAVFFHGKCVESFDMLVEDEIANYNT